MSDALSVRRMIENEVVFRRYNEDVQKSFEKIKRQARQTNQEHLILDDDTPLHFYCECSDENCRQRVQLKPSHYTKIHKDRDRFVLLDGHETEKIEKVVRRAIGYNVVQKFVEPSENVQSLQPTNVDNS